MLQHQTSIPNCCQNDPSKCENKHKLINIQTAVANYFFIAEMNPCRDRRMFRGILRVLSLKFTVTWLTNRQKQVKQEIRNTIFMTSFTTSGGQRTVTIMLRGSRWHKCKCAEWALCVQCVVDEDAVHQVRQVVRTCGPPRLCQWYLANQSQCLTKRTVVIQCNQNKSPTPMLCISLLLFLHQTWQYFSI